MKLLKLLTVCLCLPLTLVHAQSKKELQAKVDELNKKVKEMEEAAKPKGLENEVDTLSYAIGQNIAMNLKQQGIESLNVEVLSNAFEDVYEGKPFKINPNESGQIVNTYLQKLNEKRVALMKAEGENFLAKNKEKKGVVTLPSGLQYEVLTAGTGPKPKATDQVTTHYHGTLVDGSVFDSSVQRGQPATFPVNGVIKGWQEALQLMPVGSKWRLYIPYNLAYGERGAGQSIPPYAALIFDVELLNIVAE